MTCAVENVNLLMPDGTPVNYDGAPVNAFKLIFDKIPKTVFFLQGFDVPGVSVTPINFNTRILDINEIGEKISYQPFNVDFLVSSDLGNYQELYDWMKQITVSPNQRDEVSDAQLIINNNRIIKFVDCFPVAIGGMQFKANITEMQYITCTATFAYDWYELTKY